MGYYDEDGFYFHEEEDLADPGGGVSAMLNLPIRALPAAIRSRVIAEMAANPAFEDAADEAVQATVAGLDILTGPDDRSPRLGETGHVMTFMDSQDRLLGWFDAEEGALHTPAGVVAPGLPLDGGGAARVHEFMDSRDRLLGWFDAEQGAFHAPGGVVSGTKRARLPLTAPSSDGTTWTILEGSVRYPARATCAMRVTRVGLRNYNDRSNKAYPSTVTVPRIYAGSAGYGPDGISGAFAAAPVEIRSTPLEVVGSSDSWVTIPDGGIPLARGQELLIAFDYTSTGTAHAGHGGGWTAATGTAAEVAPALTRVDTMPLDVWIEVEIDGATKVIAAPGDSLTVGAESTFPLRDSWLSVLCLAIGAMPRLMGNSGATIDEWLTPTQRRWTRYADLPKPDLTVLALGSNNWGNGEGLASMQAKYASLVNVARAQLGPTLYGTTILPRNVGTASDAIRQDWNAWLQTLPHGLVEVFDTAAPVTDPTTPARLRADLQVDGVHLTTPGYALMASAIRLS